MTDVILNISELRKSYVYSHLWTKTVTPALLGINLQINRNDIFALIGLNGSGKTTTIKLLLGLIKPDGGNFQIFNSFSVTNDVKKKIGYLPEIPYFNKDFTPYEMLRFWGNLSGIPKQRLNDRIIKVLEYTSLGHTSKSCIRGFSRGMMQRLGLAQALLAEPELLILDEPMSGLDPKGIIDIRELMHKLKEDGKTIFFCSHLIAEVQKIADKVGIIHAGKIIKVIVPHDNLEDEFLETIRAYDSNENNS